MESKYTNILLTVIAVCLIWLSVKDFVVTKVVTKIQLEAILEATDAPYKKWKESSSSEIELGKNYFFRLPISGSVDVEFDEPIAVEGDYYGDGEPIRVVIDR